MVPGQGQHTREPACSQDSASHVNQHYKVPGQYVKQHPLQTGHAAQCRHADPQSGPADSEPHEVSGLEKNVFLCVVKSHWHMHVLTSIIFSAGRS